LLVTSEEYRFIAAEQLRQVDITECRIVLEPIGRNTAPALTVAALLSAGSPGEEPGGGAAAAITGAGTDPILLVMPSDHLIADLAAFHQALAEGAEQAAGGAIVVFGIVPTTPETGYGYICTGGAIPDARTARSLAGFTEKPDLDTARGYLADGRYLWNSGMFMVRSSVWLAAIERCRPGIAAACHAAVAGASSEGVFLRLGKAAFAACPSESIDYAVMERLGEQAGAAAQPAAPSLWGAVIPLAAGCGRCPTRTARATCSAATSSSRKATAISSRRIRVSWRLWASKTWLSSRRPTPFSLRRAAGPRTSRSSSIASRSTTRTSPSSIAGSTGPGVGTNPWIRGPASR
jgi:mannose-1-phosphate guanylyltransferase/mannose-6-phosphate isomerase